MNNEWEVLINEIRNCRKCPLFMSRKNPVPGEGSVNTNVMFIGEAPGSTEDETGRPFVGAAGKLLTQLIESIGLKRSEVYITNVVKCRPPENRDPTDEEIEACSPYLVRQIKLIKPKLIVCLGRHSARFLFINAGLKWRNMSLMHGKVFSVKLFSIDLKILATYHPAAALYYPKLRSELEKDFKTIALTIREIRSSSEGRSGTLLDFFKY